MTTTKKRQTQAERTAATRKRLLDATVACLDEHGYAGTSTTLVSERAGVSRGAQLHHFPTKADLVVATIEHVFERHHAGFKEAIQRTSGNEDRIAAAIDLLWQAMSSEDNRYVWIELVVGTRTEPLLREKVHHLTRRLGELMVETFHEDVAGTTLMPEIAVAVATALMDGLLLRRMAGQDDERTLEIIEAFKNLAMVATAALRLVGPDVLTASASKTGESHDD